MDDSCKTITLNNVIIQENGIIRAPDNYIIGRLVDGIDFASYHLNINKKEGGAVKDRKDMETIAALVHQAYLDTCKKLGWNVKPENQIPYAGLSEDSKELDRASVRAVLDYIKGEKS